MTNALTLSGYSASQLDTIRRTVARDSTDDEFNLFMEACRSYKLDPFRKQIHLVIYSKNNPEKRSHSIIVSRDGLRVLAQRCQDYRPASEPPTVEYDDALKGPTNPKGIASASVRLWKQDNGGEWYPVYGEAEWDEFAPVTDEWAYDPEKGKRQPTGKKVLDASGQWAKMPKNMIVKCAEAQALRAGWPDQFANVYSEEEFDRINAEASASEMLEQHHQQEREARTGGPGVLMVFDDTAQLVKVPMGEVADRCLEYIGENDAETVHLFEVRNAAALRDFWAHSPNDALEVKKALEAKTADIGKGNAA